MTRSRTGWRPAGCLSALGPPPSIWSQSSGSEPSWQTGEVPGPRGDRVVSHLQSSLLSFKVDIIPVLPVVNVP